MSKWIALVLIIVGLVAGNFRVQWPPGEFGLPVHALAGWLCFSIGICWLGALIFVRL